MVLRSLMGAAIGLALAATSAAAQPSGGVSAPAPAAAAAPAATPYTPIVARGTLLQTLQQAGQFRTLLKVLDMAGLSGPALLARPQAITIFAPTDAAFAAMPAGELTQLMQAANVGQLQQRFAYHIYNGPLEWSKLKDHAGPVTTAVQKPLYIDGASTPPKANDATILQAELIVSNGSIYVIDKVLSPGFVPPAAAAPEASAPAAAAPAPGK